MIKKIAVIWILIPFVFSSCEKEEIPVCPPVAGDVELIEVAMGVDYRNQIFFDLETSSVIHQNLKTEWDLGFECSEDGWRVITNTAKAMFVANSGVTEFSEPVDIDNLNWVWDNPNGDLNETAIGDWANTPEILIVDQGYDWVGAHQGYKKLFIESLENEIYQFTFSDLDGSNLSAHSLQKNSNKNFQCFSFSNGGNEVDIQPDKYDWDLLFTQYLESLDDGNEIVYYLVTGVLMNHQISLSILEETMSFEDITLEYAQAKTMSTALNEIGFDWKFYDFQTGTFIVNSEKAYIIKDANGIFFKLRFMDFYNLNGEKGHPNFELQRL